ncbi:E3 ubiquitin-protein ligase CHIP-like [Clavelina lepadiformis]|uniref:E3 ubiquitin-protein ligase CHIP-like n=1 Tax=Clavelina lepadiformis TaxID=159417 RepID=UPI004041E5C2
MAAMQYKLEGNRLFSQKKYEEAIKQYSKAINKNGSTAVFYTNRALCNLKLQRWKEVISDCKLALDHDAQSVKGHFFIGQSDVELDRFDDAIVHLTKAHELAKQQKLNFGDDIAATLRSARKKKWEKAERERIREEIELQTYLNDLINKDKKRELEERRKLEEDASKDDEDEVGKKFEKRKEELNSLFAQIDERRKKRDVPDYLCGKISFEIMKDPVITPSGITYDRKDIEEHLQRVGHFDPVTRHELKLTQLIPNLAMKEAISHFVEDNGWVEDY